MDRIQMVRMKSLLNKTLTQFIVCTIIILLLATPLFYLLTKHYYAEDMIDIIEATHKINPFRNSIWNRTSCKA